MFAKDMNGVSTPALVKSRVYVPSGSDTLE